MPLLKRKSPKFGRNYRYKLLPLDDYSSRCIKIIDIDSCMISFIDSSGSARFIKAQFLPFWGRDVFAEVLYDLYGSAGLIINNSRSKDYYDEAKSYLREKDFIEFCNIHKTRWRKLICLDSNNSGFT